MLAFMGMAVGFFSIIGGALLVLLGVLSTLRGRW